MSQPIRVLLTISDLCGGGAERQFSLLIHRLSRQRFEPHLCFWRPVFTFPYPADLTPTMIGKTRPWHVVRAVGSMRRLIDELAPQLVFSQLHYVNMVTGTALARCRHRPRWICRHDNDPRRVMKGPFAMWARWALRRADRVLGCSEGVSQAMVDYLRLAPERVQTILNGVEVSRIDRLAREPLPLRKSPQVFTVAHAGRFHRQKNQGMLLEAFSRFRGQPAELWMLGEGSLEAELRARARGLGIEDQVRWLGFQDNPYPFFRAADCVVLTSDWEGLPMVIIEAMTAGTPFVSTRCRYGPEEMIEDGKSGLLTPAGDVDAFAAALARLAGDPEGARRMGAYAREKAVARFDIDAICTIYEQLFTDVVHSPCPA